MQKKIIVPAGLMLALALLAPGAVAADPITDLTGYWTGAGTVSLQNGNTEKVKCAVTYKVSAGGTEVKQNMRCASQDYSINASADLIVKGSQVTGKWEEKTYSATGDVTGKYTGSAFTLSIQGGSFTAAMNVGLSACKQTISIAPQGLDVKRVSLGLAKC